MAVKIEEIIEKALEEAFARALDQAIQTKAEAAFAMALENGAPPGTKLQQKIEEGPARFIEEGIQWDTKKAWLQEVTAYRAID